MKFEEIKVGENYTVNGDTIRCYNKIVRLEQKHPNKYTEERVIEFVSQQKNIVIKECDLDSVKPLTKKLPETGLVVDEDIDRIMMRTGKDSGYGFTKGKYFKTTEEYTVYFDSTSRPATKADEKRWKELLEKEIRNRYVKGQNIDAFNKDIMFGYEGFASINFQNMGFFIGKLNEFSCDVDQGWNAVVFQDGKWAEIIEDEKKDLHEIARSVEGEELDKLIDILHEKKVTSKFESEGFKILKK